MRKIRTKQFETDQSRWLNEKISLKTMTDIKKTGGACRLPHRAFRWSISKCKSGFCRTLSIKLPTLRMAWQPPIIFFQNTLFSFQSTASKKLAQLHQATYAKCFVDRVFLYQLNAAHRLKTLCMKALKRICNCPVLMPKSLSSVLDVLKKLW